MNKFIVALAVAACVAVADSRADFGGPPRPGAGGGAAPPANTANQYGWNPILKKVFWWKKDDCSTGNCGGKAGCPGGNCAPAMGGAPVGGTLVFPQHQFARSPRDYFMYGHGGN